ncbi:MAG: hypothetical protein IMZ43_09860 [Thermoplasmata archaeon]|nr:hypothetical protein [Thermoplasmata archaeon]
MIRLSKKLIIIILLVLIPTLVFAAVLYPRGSTVRVAWDDDQVDIEYYEVILIRDGTGETYGPYQTVLKEIEVKRPRSGIYEVRVRSYKDGEYSTWCSSIDGTAMLHNMVRGMWKVFFKLLGPTGPIIIY